MEELIIVVLFTIAIVIIFNRQCKISIIKNWGLRYKELSKAQTYLIKSLKREIKELKRGSYEI